MFSWYFWWFWHKISWKVLQISMIFMKSWCNFSKIAKKHENQKKTEKSPCTFIRINVRSPNPLSISSVSNAYERQKIKKYHNFQKSDPETNEIHRKPMKCIDYQCFGRGGAARRRCVIATRVFCHAMNAPNTLESCYLATRASKGYR